MPTLKSGSFSFRSNSYTVLNRKGVMISNFPIRSFITDIVNKRILKWPSFLLNALMSLIEIFRFYRLLFYTCSMFFTGPLLLFVFSLYALCVHECHSINDFIVLSVYSFMRLCILINCCPLNKFLFCILFI